jgi:hypothetical protein
MPPPHKASGVIARTSTNGRNANTELTRLERQPINAQGSNGSKATAAKNASIPKTSGTTKGSGSGINSSYREPDVKKP